MAARILLLLPLCVLLTGLVAGCGGANDLFWIGGNWRGEATFEEAGTTRDLHFDIFNPPGSPFRLETQVVILNITGDGGCALSIDYGAILVEDNGSISFPVHVVEPGTCFPDIAPAELEDGGRLELNVSGTFNDAADTAGGAITVRTARGSDVLTTYLDGTWAATRDPNEE